jgi:hypothetical protein
LAVEADARGAGRAAREREGRARAAGEVDVVVGVVARGAADRADELRGGGGGGGAGRRGGASAVARRRRVGGGGGGAARRARCGGARRTWSQIPPTLIAAAAWLSAAQGVRVARGRSPSQQAGRAPRTKVVSARITESTLTRSHWSRGLEKNPATRQFLAPRRSLSASLVRAAPRRTHARAAYIERAAMDTEDMPDVLAAPGAAAAAAAAAAAEAEENLDEALEDELANAFDEDEEEEAAVAAGAAAPAGAAPAEAAGAGPSSAAAAAAAAAAGAAAGLPRRAGGAVDVARLDAAQRRAHQA